MKKFCFFIMIFCLSFVLVSCSFKKQVTNNISEKDEFLFSSEDENFFVTLCIGKRENPYVVDGKSAELIDFAVLTAHKKQNNLQNNKVIFSIQVGSENRSGTFEVNPFDGSYVVDLLSVGNNFENINLKITADGKDFYYTLSNALKETDAKSDEVLSIALKEISKIEKEITNNGKLSFEVYVRLMQNAGQIPLWYVSVMNQSEQLFALIIHPETKEVIAKNF